MLDLYNYMHTNFSFLLMAKAIFEITFGNTEQEAWHRLEKRTFRAFSV